MTAHHNMHSTAVVDFIVNIDVDDLRKAACFYRDAFGLRIGRHIGDSILEMLGGPTPIYLLLKPADSVAMTGTTQRRSYRRHWTPLHLDLVVDDLKTAVARALRGHVGISCAIWRT